jgi:hypothetical protein
MFGLIGFGIRNPSRMETGKFDKGNNSDSRSEHHHIKFNSGFKICNESVELIQRRSDVIHLFKKKVRKK